MEENRGFSTGTIVISSVLILIVSFLAIFIVSYWSAANYGARTEALLKGYRDNNQNILAQYQQKILEAVQVPEMYKNDFKEIIQNEMTGRYGSDGSKATFQWIQERSLNFDSKLYSNLQDMIASGRKDFEQSQTRMIDARIQYETQSGYLWRGFFLSLAGYPKIDLKEYNPIITDRVEETFKNGKESSPLKLR
jgi:hypothetical protein